MKKIRIGFLFLLMMCLGLNLGVIAAGEIDDSVTVNKTATKNEANSRWAEVTLVVETDLALLKNVDIVLVLDVSGSMNNKIGSLRNDSITLVEKLLPEGGTNNVRVGIVTFGNGATIIHDLSKDASSLKNAISGISANGGTDMDAGLAEANSLLNETNHSKVVILLSDGVPNSEQTAKEEARKLKEEKQVVIYAIGFGVAPKSTAEYCLKAIATDEQHYYLAGSDELGGIYQRIVGRYIFDAVVTDIIPAGFHLIPNTLVEATYVVNDDNTTTITWPIKDFKDNNHLSYQIEANDDDYGNMYTNKEATLTTVTADNSKKSYVFPKPYVPIPSIAVDDEYFLKPVKNSTFTVEQPGILANDKLKTKHSDKEATVTNRIVMLEDKEHPKTAGALSDITINPSTGALTFKMGKSKHNITTYKYYIETTIVTDDKLMVVNSNPATITFAKTLLTNPTTGGFIPVFIIIGGGLIFYLMKRHQKVKIPRV